MNSFKKKNHFFSKNIVTKLILFLVSVTTIVYFLPQGGKFNYQFENEKPWKYGLLQASFNFPIYKNEAEVAKEQDSILKLFQPYFYIDKGVEEEITQKLRSDYTGRLKGVIPNHDYLKQIERTLHTIYQQGVASSSDLTMLEMDSLSSILIVDRNMAYSLETEKLLSIREAYEKLIYADTLTYSPFLLQQCDLTEYLTPNMVYDQEKSKSAKEELLGNISWASGFVVNGQRIIDRGEIVNKQTYQILESLRKEWEKRGEGVEERRMTMTGRVLFVSMLMLCFMIYLELYRKEYYQHRGSMVLLFALIVFTSLLTSLAVEYNFTSIYVIPFAMVPIIIQTFLDSRTAFTAHIMTVLISSIALHYPYEFILMQIVAGMVAIFTLRELSQRSQLFRTALFVGVSYGLIYLAFDLIEETDITKLDTRMYLYIMLNGILLLFTYPLLFILEKTFGFTSNVTLIELSNINTPLLREMSEIAPGTFQHSLQVSNLAAAAANKIGANGQLARTGALYHDIGKTVNPAFFTENQAGVNPHHSLNYKQSAQVVISHISDGLKLADKYNLPQAVKDFIPTHHGAGKAKYFYISYQNEHPDEVVDPADFSYPGPNPFTKEQAILLMADSVEAASRSLVEYTEENINTLVDKIVDGQVADGYFKECPITFKDIEQVKRLFKEKLRTMYHTRISYPELKK
ncbi:MAG: HD family phosphohydrolase [Phocaeicola sp.]